MSAFPFLNHNFNSPLIEPVHINSLGKAMDKETSDNWRESAKVTTSPTSNIEVTRKPSRRSSLQMIAVPSTEPDRNSFSGVPFPGLIQCTVLTRSRCRCNVYMMRPMCVHGSYIAIALHVPKHTRPLLPQSAQCGTRLHEQET